MQFSFAILRVHLNLDFWKSFIKKSVTRYCGEVVPHEEKLTYFWWSINLLDLEGRLNLFMVIFRLATYAMLLHVYNFYYFV